MNVRRSILFSCTLLITAGLHAQSDSTSLEGKLISSAAISQKYLNQVSTTTNKLEEKLDKKSAQALERMQKQEDRIRKKLAAIDSLKAKELFGNAEQQYKNLQAKATKAI